MQKRFLIVGCGDVGNTIAQRLLTAGHQVYGLRRNIDQLLEGVQPIALNLMADQINTALPEVDYLLYTAAAKSRDEETYRNVYVEGAKRIIAALPRAPKRAFVIGSTGVFGQSQGEWITEKSPVEPPSVFGELLREGETLFEQAPFPATVIRSSGIYGPGRTHLLSRVREGVIAVRKPEHFSNRIHRDDLADFLVHLIALDITHKPLETLYLASDGAPAPIHEVTRWLAQQMNIQWTKEVPIQRGGNKRIANEGMMRAGYQCRYPDYRAGFAALLDH